MKKNTKELLFLIGISFAIFLSITLISGTTSLYAPLDFSNQSTNVALSCNTTRLGITNVTFRTNLSGVIAIIGTNVSNSTADDSSFNLTTAISSLTDSADYSIYCTVYNATFVENSTTMRLNVTFDSTDPTCSVTDAKENVEEGGFNTLSYVITDAIDPAVTVSCSTTVPGGSTVSSGSTTPYTLTGVNTRRVGVYTYNCSGTDASTNINSCIETFRVDSSEDISPSKEAQKDISRSSSNAMFIFLMLGVLVIIVAVVAIISSTSKSKKRRR